MTTEPELGESAGALLRAARERQGLHIAALAAAIKVAPRKLDALENDRWHELPDATFVRALAQTVCRTLKIDARPVLERLPAAGAVSLEPTRGALNEPFRDRPGRDEPSFALAAVRPMVWAGGALMLAALVVYLLPADLLDRVSRPAAVPASAPAAAAVPVPPPVPASAALAAADAASAGTAPVADAASGSTGSAAVSAGGLPASPAVAGGETVFSAPPPGVAASAPTAAGLVVLRTSEASWVEVRDARGQLLLSRIVQPGESVGLNGALPLRLTIGNAAATQLSFRGQPVDLSSRSKDNVARLELP